MKARVMLAVLLAATAYAVPSTAQTLEKIAASNTITVSYRESAVPFSYALSPTRAVGFAVDLSDEIVAEIRKRLDRPGLRVVRIPVNGQNRIPLLVDGTYDLECGSTTNTAARGQEVAFAISHFYTGTRILVRKASAIKGYADLSGQQVAAPAGSTNEKVLRKYGDERQLDLRLVASKDYGDGLQMLEDGRVAALALDDVLLYGLKANAKDPAALEVVGETLQLEPYGCMVRKGDPVFKQLVDSVIARLMTSGAFARLYTKWFETPIPPKGVNLGMPMSPQLRANLKGLSDQPAK